MAHDDKGGTKGVVGLFDDPDVILSAARNTRDRGYQNWDVFTPFPVHGMDEAMGLGKSHVPWITFAFGTIGFSFAIFLQVWTMTYSWPITYGGKPHLPWPSFVPITFEMTVLLAGLATAFGSLWIGGVFRPKKPRVDPRVT